MHFVEAAFHSGEAAKPHENPNRQLAVVVRPIACYGVRECVQQELCLSADVLDRQAFSIQPFDTEVSVWVFARLRRSVEECCHRHAPRAGRLNARNDFLTFNGTRAS
jgi:hypothetical protein